MLHYLKKFLIVAILLEESLTVYADASSEEILDSASRNFAFCIPLSKVPPDSLIQRGNFCIFSPFKFK